MNQSVGLRPHAWRVIGGIALTIGIVSGPASCLFLPTFGATPAASGAAPPAAPPPKSKGKEDEPVVLQSSKPMTQTGSQWQKWDDYLSIKTGQEHAPLTLAFENGTGGGAKFSDLRIFMAGKPLASIKDFKGLPTLNLNLTDAVGVGDSLLTIQGYGPIGARVSWKLVAPRPVVTAVNPKEFGLKDKVVVQGRNFSERAAVDLVTIGGKPVGVALAKKESLELKLPKELPGGKQDLVVTVGTLKSNAFKVTVKAIPEVSSVNYLNTAPGQPVVVYGKGFSTTASENQIFFGGVQATITAVTGDSISCVVPELDSPQWYIPITVKTNGIDSTGTVTINISQRVIPNEGQPEQ